MTFRCNGSPDADAFHLPEICLIVFNQPPRAALEGISIQARQARLSAKRTP
jgi:hypothetical protein